MVGNTFLSLFRYPRKQTLYVQHAQISQSVALVPHVQQVHKMSPVSPNACHVVREKHVIKCLLCYLTLDFLLHRRAQIRRIKLWTIEWLKSSVFIPRHVKSDICNPSVLKISKCPWQKLLRGPKEDKGIFHKKFRHSQCFNLIYSHG